MSIFTAYPFLGLKDKDIPFTDILNDVGPSSQYVSTTGQLFLNG